MRFLRFKKDRGKISFDEVRFLRKEERFWERGDLRVLVIDTNLCLDHALRFVEDGCIVYYYVADISAFPKMEDNVSGQGFSGVVKVADFGEVIDEVDLVYISDSCFPWLARFLRDRGKNVFGSTPLLAKFEDDRVFAYERLQELGVDVPEGKICRGWREVLDYISRNEGAGRRFFVKINKWRGDIETFSAASVKEAETILSQAGFGPYLDELEFLVQRECEGIEIGCDAWVCPEGVCLPVSYTIEEKGRGNVAVWQSEESGFLKHFYDRIFELIRQDGYCGMLCVEGFWDGKSFKVIDVTPRCPFPVSSLYPRFVRNFTELVYNISIGRRVEVEVDWSQKFMAEITISTDEKGIWRVIEFDYDLLRMKDNDGIGLRRAVMKDEKVWFVPGDGLVATANAKAETVEGALDKAVKLAESVKCMFSQFDGQFVESVLEKIRRLKSLGGDFVFE